MFFKDEGSINFLFVKTAMLLIRITLDTFIFVYKFRRSD